MNMHTLKNRLLTIFIPLIIISLAIQPLLTGHMPWQGDGLLHYVRLAVLENDIGRGDWFPRWSPDLAYGYGFPLFNFYAPFSYYVGLPFRWLGFSLKAATNASYILALWTLVTGAYLWGKDGGGKLGGGFAAFLLCYNPYILNNLLHRSALGELWGLAWLMMTLWAIHRLFDGRFRNGRSRLFLVATLCYTLLMLSHNITALIGTPFILGYAFFRCFIPDPTIEGYNAPFSRQKLSFLLFVPLALALSAFFWLPAFVEKDLVQVERLVDGDNFAYSNHFIASEVTPSPSDGFPADAAWLNRPLPWGASFQRFSVGILMISMLLIAVFLKIRGTLSRKDHFAIPIGAHFIAWLIPFFLTSAASVAIWDQLPLLHFVQFPWRFLGLCGIAFMMLLVKSGQTWMSLALQTAEPTKKTGQQSSLKTAFIAAFLLFSQLFMLGSDMTEAMNVYFWPTPHPPLPLLDSQTTADLTAFELETGWLGTTAAGDYLPRTVQTLPRPEQQPPLDPLALTDQPYQVTEPTALQFSQFYFSNWQAYKIDPSTQKAIPLDLKPSEPYGFLEIEFDTGAYWLEFRQAATPIQHIGNLISLVASISLLGYVAISARLFFAPIDIVPGRKLYHQDMNDELFTWVVLGLFWLMLLVPAGFAVAKTAVLDHRDSAFHVFNQSQPFRWATLGDTTSGINFDNQLYLVGVDDSGQDEQNRFELRLFWRANQPTQDYSISLQVLDREGYRYGQNDHLHPGHLPVTRWPENTYVSDDHLISVMPGAPMQPYQVYVIVYDENGRRLNVLNDAGQPIGTAHSADFILAKDLSPDELVLSYAEAVFDFPICQDETVCLAGYNLIPLEQSAVGGLVPITFFLQRQQIETTQVVPYMLDLSLVNQETQQRISLNSAVGATERYGNVQRRENDQSFYWDRMAYHTRRQEHAFRIPALFDDGSPVSSGSYTLYFADTPLRSFDVTSPDRQFEAQSLPLVVGNQLGNLVHLNSASVNQDLTALTADTPLKVSLLWQALATTDQSYKVFVQLLDSDQRVVAQSDQLPTNQGESRPTISWVPDEYLFDTHQLQLPADFDSNGTYTLIAGLYNEANGERLSIDNEEFNLTYLTIQP